MKIDKARERLQAFLEFTEKDFVDKFFKNKKEGQKQIKYIDKFVN